MGGTEEDIRGVIGGGPWVPKSQEQALDQSANEEGDRRKEGNHDQAGQYQVIEDTEQDQGALQAEG